MPRIKHVVEIDCMPSFRAAKVAGMFDVPVAEKLRREWDINLPIEDKHWQIGLIVGASGSGKSTISAQAFGQKLHHGFAWSAPCLLDDFPASCDAKTITETLSKVGFSSPPQWMLPYSALSNGQKFIVELARCLLEYDDLFVFDEFTSVVDRQVAQIGSFAFQKAVRKSSQKFVAVTCHYDVEPWLQPDWVLDMSSGEFKWGSLRRPDIRLEIFRVDHKAWRLFAGYHYLSADMNRSAAVYVGLIDGTPAALCAALPFPHPVLKSAWKEHRTVVLPDFQGIGIGNAISEQIGEILYRQRKMFISTTSHPAMIHHRIKSDRWMLTRKPSRTAKAGATGMQRGSTAHGRLSASFRYIPTNATKAEA